MSKQQYIYKNKLTGDYVQFDVEQRHPHLELIRAEYYKGNLLYGTPWQYNLAIGWYVVYRMELEDVYVVAARGGWRMETFVTCNLLRTATRICTHIATAFPDATVRDRGLIHNWIKLSFQNRTKSHKTKEYGDFLRTHNLKSLFRPIGKGYHAKKER